MNYATFEKKKSLARSSGKAVLPGLRVGKVNDSLEQQADRVAEEVLSGNNGTRD